jgi:hypothetical protein
VGVDQHQPVESNGPEDAGSHARAQRATTGAAVLSGIAEIRDDSCEASGARTAAGVGQEQQLHQVLIRRWTGGLQQVDVIPADGLLNLELSFTIRKAPALI